jgi:hypothetical protein
MGSGRYNEEAIEAFAQAALKDGFCLLRDHFSKAALESWHHAFLPLLEHHIAHEGHLQNRGPRRYYVTLPFTTPFADPRVYEDEDVLAICERLVGRDLVMCQLATDTPVRGSEYQEIHRDALPLFPETGIETPPFQLAVNFPLINVTPDTGPFEVARGTHLMTKEEGMRHIESGRIKLDTRRAGTASRNAQPHRHATPDGRDRVQPTLAVSPRSFHTCASRCA